MAVNVGDIIAPINIAEPYSAMGITPSGDWDVVEPIALKGDVRKWSFYKPVIADKPGEMIMPDDFYAVNDGFSFVTYSYPASAIQAAMPQTDGNWAYNRPIENVHWGRSSDWDGYNHNDTKSWFDLSFTKTGDTIGVRTHRRGSVVWEFPQMFKATESWHGAKTEVYSVGLIFQKKGTPAVGTATFYRFGTNLNVSDGEEYDMTFSASEAQSNLDSGTYYVIPCITTYMTGGKWQTLRSDSSYGVWYAFPPTNYSSMATYTVGSSMTSTLDNVTVDFYGGSEVGGTTYRFENITLTLNNSGAALNGVNVSARFKDYQYITAGNSEQFISQSVDIPQQGSVDIEVNFDKSEYGYIDVEFIERAHIEVTLMYGTESKTFDIYPFE